MAILAYILDIGLSYQSDKKKLVQAGEMYD